MERHVRFTGQSEKLGKQVPAGPGRYRAELGRVEGVSANRVGLAKHHVTPEVLMPLEIIRGRNKSPILRGCRRGIEEGLVQANPI